MHGTVLLLKSEGSWLAEVDVLRAKGLIVYACDELEAAVQQLQQVAPDVVVVMLSAAGGASIVSALRGLVDHATSIIVTSGSEQREPALAAGADSFLLNSAEPADLAYEIHRALILRRSGRRVPWNW